LVILETDPILDGVRQGREFSENVTVSGFTHGDPMITSLDICF